MTLLFVHFNNISQILQDTLDGSYTYVRRICTHQPHLVYFVQDVGDTYYTESIPRSIPINSLQVVWYHNSIRIPCDLLIGSGPRP